MSETDVEIRSRSTNTKTAGEAVSLDVRHACCVVEVIGARGDGGHKRNCMQLRGSWCEAIAGDPPT
jgi:hypothetical protein